MQKVLGKLLAFNKIQATKAKYSNNSQVFCSSSSSSSTAAGTKEVQTSIFSDVSAFDTDKIYCPNHAVKRGGFFRYALFDKLGGAAFVEANWGGTAVDNIDGTTRPEFFWKPSYKTESPKEPRVNRIKFGEGFEQRIRDGINHNLLMLDYQFSNRDMKEAFAILHFLEQRGGTEVFLHTPSFPYREQKRFVCRTWSSNRQFYDNFSIKAKFEEVPI